MAISYKQYNDRDTTIKSENRSFSVSIFTGYIMVRSSMILTDLHPDPNKGKKHIDSDEGSSKNSRI